jgi:hypothetical protein
MFRFTAKSRFVPRVLPHAQALRAAGERAGCCEHCHYNGSRQSNKWPPCLPIATASLTC